VRGDSAPDLFEALISPAVPAVVFVADRVLQVVILVPLFHRPEFSSRSNLGVHLVGGEPRLHYSPRLLRLLQFLIRRRKNSAAIAGALIAKLTFVIYTYLLSFAE
jgi:hypothetical protein